MSCFIIPSQLLEVYCWLQVEKVWSLQDEGERAGRLRCVGTVWETKAQAYEGQRSRILLSFCFVQFLPLSQIFVYWTYLLTNLCEIQNLLFLETFSSRWKQAECETGHAHTSNVEVWKTSLFNQITVLKDVHFRPSIYI